MVKGCHQGGSYSDMTGVCIKKGNLVKMHRQEECRAKRVMLTQVKKMPRARRKASTDPSFPAPRRNQPCQQLDRSLFDSRTIRRCNSVKSTILWCFVMKASGNPRIHGGLVQGSFRRYQNPQMLKALISNSIAFAYNLHTSGTP